MIEYKKRKRDHDDDECHMDESSKRLCLDIPHKASSSRDSETTTNNKHENHDNIIVQNIRNGINKINDAILPAQDYSRSKNRIMIETKQEIFENWENMSKVPQSMVKVLQSRLTDNTIRNRNDSTSMKKGKMKRPHYIQQELVQPHVTNARKTYQRTFFPSEQIIKNYSIEADSLEENRNDDITVMIDSVAPCSDAKENRTQELPIINTDSKLQHIRNEIKKLHDIQPSLHNFLPFGDTGNQKIQKKYKSSIRFLFFLLYCCSLYLFVILAMTEYTDFRNQNKLDNQPTYGNTNNDFAPALVYDIPTDECTPNKELCPMNVINYLKKVTPRNYYDSDVIQKYHKGFRIRYSSHNNNVAITNSQPNMNSAFSHIQINKISNQNHNFDNPVIFSTLETDKTRIDQTVDQSSLSSTSESRHNCHQLHDQNTQLVNQLKSQNSRNKVLTETLLEAEWNQTELLLQIVSANTNQQKFKNQLSKSEKDLLHCQLQVHEYEIQEDHIRIIDKLIMENSNLKEELQLLERKLEQQAEEAVAAIDAVVTTAHNYKNQQLLHLSYHMQTLLDDQMFQAIGAINTVAMQAKDLQIEGKKKNP